MSARKAKPLTIRKAWFHAECEDAEYWSSMCRTKREAIRRGRAAYEGRKFVVARGHRPDPASFIRVDAAWLFEHMHENAFEEHSENAEHWVDGTIPPSKRAQAELAKFLQAWARKHAPTNFWDLDYSTLITITGAEE